MTNAIQTRESNGLVEFNSEKLQLIKSMFAKDATDMEFNLFISMAKRLQLDPVIKQIYFVKFGGKMSIIVGIDGYRLIADRTGKYMPGKETTYTYDTEGKLFSATSYVKKLGPDHQWHEFGSTAIRSEYDTGINQWKKGCHYMLAKCAESLALRRGWPSEYSGTHSEEEMDKARLESTGVIDIPANSIALLCEKYSGYPSELVRGYAESCGAKRNVTAEVFANECLKVPPLFEKYFDKWLESNKPKPIEEIFVEPKNA